MFITNIPFHAEQTVDHNHEISTFQNDR